MTKLIGFRAHKPQWSFAPKSGEGAKKHGGRWNPRGTPALYLSLDQTTAIAETMLGFDLRPVTLVQYTIEGGRFADYRDPDFRAKHGLRDDLTQVPWQGRHPPAGGWPSQQAAVKLIAAGFHGLLCPSAVANGSNLVLWKWDEDDAPTVTFHDDHGDLPKNQDSWR